MTHNFKTDLSNVAYHYLQSLRIKVTATSVRKALQENPHYPSLFSLTKVFNRFQIDNQALRIKAENLGSLHPPFIAYMNNTSTGADFVLVTGISATGVAYLKEGSKPRRVARAEFLKDFKEIIFLAGKNEASGEQDYIHNLETEKKARYRKKLAFSGIALVALSVVFISLYPFNTINWEQVALLLVKFTGLSFALLLLAYDLDKGNSMVKKICSINKESGCDAVLKGKNAGIFGIKWSEIGYLYFAGSLLFMLYPGLAFDDKLPWLAIAGTATAPYIVFSIYYQWKIIKHWCPLCLAVQFVLFAELVWSVFSFWISPNFIAIEPAVMIPVIIVSLVLPILVMYTLKPLILESKEGAGYETAYKRLLYSPGTFNSLLAEQETIHEGWDHLGIDLGNPAAKNRIVKVCNPYCGPCAQAHTVLEEILSGNNDVNLKIIFTAGQQNRNAEIVTHLLAIAARGDSRETGKALDEWYSNDKKDYDAFAIKYPVYYEPAQMDSMLKAMNEWCTQARIIHTPTLFVNGKKMPPDYDIEELKYIL